MFDPSTNFLNVHEWAYGVTEIVHILSLTLAVGLIAVVDIRLLGYRVAGLSGARLHRETGLASMIGLVLAVTSGFLIFSTDPVRYFEHPTMRAKIVGLVVAIAFNYTIHSRVAVGGYGAYVERVVAVTSLALWIGVTCGGIFYSFT